MSALTDLKARITGADGSLFSRTRIAAELERAIAEDAESLEDLAKRKGAKLCPFLLFSNGSRFSFTIKEHAREFLNAIPDVKEAHP